MPQPPATIDDVLSRLEKIVDDGIRQGSPIGYFGALYERVTLGIKRAIVARAFDDNDRMDLLDRTFAGRFLDAWDTRVAGGAPTASWQLAFDSLSDPSLLVVQHLLLGINAHINLDLGIAVATIAPGPAIAGVQRDFNGINDILARLVGAVQMALGEVSPRLKAAAAIESIEDKLFDFALDQARDGAWAFAVKLANLPTDQWPAAIAARDQDVVAVGRDIIHPGPLGSPVVKWIREKESDDVRQNIQIVGA
jgi:Family of unknown function (DUF5995)